LIVDEPARVSYRPYTGTCDCNPRARAVRLRRAGARLPVHGTVPTRNRLPGGFAAQATSTSTATSCTFLGSVRAWWFLCSGSARRSSGTVYRFLPTWWLAASVSCWTRPAVSSPRGPAPRAAPVPLRGSAPAARPSATAASPWAW